MEESKENELNYLFDDKELDEVKDNPIEIDEDFLIKMSQEIDDYLKENPLEFD